uniref:Immunoglobulin domain-containing protein n=1 Tax=Gasterosteus aculeatus aculeatus TaxID=481459 RepID=A0AAQ4PG38_GASAC
STIIFNSSVLLLVSEVSVKAGDSISIPCLYSSKYTNHVKYLCKGYYWNYCTYEVRTDQNNSVTIDTNVPNVFSVTMRGLKTESSGWYLCVSGNLQFPVRLTVTEQPTTTPLQETTHTENVSTFLPTTTRTTVQEEQNRLEGFELNS